MWCCLIVHLLSICTLDSFVIRALSTCCTTHALSEEVAFAEALLSPVLEEWDQTMPPSPGPTTLVPCGSAYDTHTYISEWSMITVVATALLPLSVFMIVPEYYLLNRM